MKRKRKKEKGIRGNGEREKKSRTGIGGRHLKKVS
jgi:hypothetical protein